MSTWFVAADAQGVAFERRPAAGELHLGAGEDARRLERGPGGDDVQDPRRPLGPHDRPDARQDPAAGVAHGDAHLARRRVADHGAPAVGGRIDVGRALEPVAVDLVDRRGDPPGDRPLHRVRVAPRPLRRGGAGGQAGQRADEDQGPDRDDQHEDQGRAPASLERHRSPSLRPRATAAPERRRSQPATARPPGETAPRPCDSAHRWTRDALRRGAADPEEPGRRGRGGARRARRGALDRCTRVRSAARAGAPGSRPSPGTESSTGLFGGRRFDDRHHLRPLGVFPRRPLRPFGTLHQVDRPAL
jgi:hypothetical protein